MKDANLETQCIHSAPEQTARRTFGADVVGTLKEPACRAFVRDIGSHHSGSVLVMAMLVTLLIVGIGLAAMFLAATEIKMSSSMSHKKEALAAAEAGVDRALSILSRTPLDWSPLLLGCGAKENDPPPAGKGMVLCDNGAPLAGIALLESTKRKGTTLQTKTMSNLKYSLYIRNDPLEVSYNGGRWFDDRNRRVVIRSEGTGLDGQSTFAVEVVITVPPFFEVTETYFQQNVDAQGSNSARSYLALP